MIWNWLRIRAKEAVLAGIGDAVVELENGEDLGHGEAARLLLARLQATSAPAIADGAAAEGRKGRGAKGGG